MNETDVNCMACIEDGTKGQDAYKIKQRENIWGKLSIISLLRVYCI